MIGLPILPLPTILSPARLTLWFISTISKHVCEIYTYTVKSIYPSAVLKKNTTINTGLEKGLQ